MVGYIQNVGSTGWLYDYLSIKLSCNTKQKTIENG